VREPANGSEGGAAGQQGEEKAGGTEEGVYAGDAKSPVQAICKPILPDDRANHWGGMRSGPTLGKAKDAA